MVETGFTEWARWRCCSTPNIVSLLMVELRQEMFPRVPYLLPGWGYRTTLRTSDPKACFDRLHVMIVFVDFVLAFYRLCLLGIILILTWLVPQSEGNVDVGVCSFCPRSPIKYMRAVLPWNIPEHRTRHAEVYKKYLKTSSIVRFKGEFFLKI